MPSTKLTLSVDPALIRVAKRLAAERGTSVSAMFARLLTAMQTARTADASALAPLTRKVSGLVSLPEGRSDRELLEDALAERHGRTG
jgi:hypothetical protein